MMMPGQSSGIALPPKQAGGTPAAMIGQYRQVNDLPSLISMYQRDPSMALLARIDEVRKSMQMQQAAQGQGAMQQAAQQPMQVDDEVIAQAMNAMGSAPRGMATGGIVALQAGGSTSRFTNEQILEAYRRNGFFGIDTALLGPRPPDHPRTSTPEQRAAAETWDREAVELAERAKQAARERGAAKATLPTPEPVALRSLTAPAGTPERGKSGDVDKDIGPAQPPRQKPLLRPRATEKIPEPAPAPAAPNALDTALAAYERASAAPAVSPELQAQRTKVSGLQALQEQQALEDAKRVREEVVRTGQRRMDRANLPLIDDAQALAALAASIDPRKGKVMGSLGAGISSALAAQEARKEKAEEYVSAASDKVRALNNTYRQLQMETAKYQQAQLEGDAAKAQDAARNIAKLRYDFAIKKEELKNETMKAEAAKADAAARGIAAGAQAAALQQRGTRVDPAEVAALRATLANAQKRAADLTLSEQERATAAAEVTRINAQLAVLGGIPEAASDVPPPGAVTEKGAK